MNYGEKLIMLRNQGNYSQKQIADRLNISQSLYARYETEKYLIPLKHLSALADFYDSSLDYIFNFTEKSTKVKKEIKKEVCAKRLKEWRRENKITQLKLAQMLNTTQSVIADYERGRYLIATPFLYTICKNFGISADYLLGKKDNKNF